MSRAALRSIPWALLLWFLVVPCEARADASAPVGSESAADLYDAGVAAHDRADFVRAAESFARADELEPNDVTLETALREALRADLPLLGMRLHARVRRVTSPGASLRAAALEVATAFGERVAWVRLECEACRAELDGQLLTPDAELPVTPGTHQLVFRGGADDPPRSVELGAGERVTLRPGKAPRREEAPSESPSTGVHPAWLTLGVVATLGFAGGAIGSFAQAKDLEAQLEEKRAARELEGAARLADEGESAETRLYAFTVLATLSALGTTALAVWAIDWTGGAASVSVSPLGFRLTRAW